jgi:hypothetical protein
MLKRQITGHETEILHSHISKAKNFNHWFTEDAILLRLNQICTFLNSENFSSSYSSFLKNDFTEKITYGIYSKENIPLEEFSTLLTILLSGNSFIYKTGEKSDKLIIFFFECLGNSFKELAQGINFTDGTIKIADKYIFTRQKEEKPEIKKYFEKKETLFEIRYQSVAVLDGNENPEALNLLGKDLFTFFGMGTGNIRKLYVPKGFDLTIFFRAIEEWHFLRDHSSFVNNYQYNKTMYLINNIPHFDNGFMLFKEDTAFRAPTGVLYYEYYDDKTDLLKRLSHSPYISFIYTSNAENNRLRRFGESVNQLLLPSDSLIKFLS